MKAIAKTSVLLLTSLLAAQSNTSPSGIDAIEGNATFAHWGGSRRFVQIDASQIGSARLISGLAWRRNGGTTQTAAGPRTFDLTVELGGANFGALSQMLDDNYLPGTRTTTFGPTNVNFPDWNPSAPGPAPFDFVATFPTPYFYVGVDALVIDFSYGNNSTTSSASTDRDFIGYTTPPAGVALGTGCIVTGRASAFSHTAYMSNLSSTPTPDYGMRFRFGGANAPASSPVILNIDFANQNLAGVACSTVYAFPSITVPLMSIASGVIPDLDIGFTYNPALLGATLFTQLLTFDAGQPGLPIAVSNGRQVTMSATPGYTTGHRCAYGWYSITGTQTGTATIFVGGGMAIELQ